MKLFNREFSIEKTRNGTAKGEAALAFLLFGLLLAFCVCSILAASLRSKTLDETVAAARLVRNRNAASFERGENTRRNLFAAKTGTASAQVSASAPILRGTLPKIGAWLDGGRGSEMVLINEKINSWTLEETDHSTATLSKNGESVILYMAYKDGDGNKQSKQGRQNGKMPAPRRTPAQNSGVVRSSGKEDGTMPRDVMNRLLLNPYDEVAKMRMIPAKDGGMTMSNLESDSVMALAGVKEGDVLQAINGVNIANLGDVTNAISSMMTGSRFDLTVSRGGKPVNLRYRVK